MEIKKIFTESPEDEQWRMLLYYTYPNNIKRYLDKNGITYTEDLIEGISGSISQAKDYFDACKASSLQIAPLLLYYGTTNLFNGIAQLITGRMYKITDHGMKSEGPDTNYKIGNIKIFPCNPLTGALSTFTSIYSSNTSTICSSGVWTLMELFGAIPDILDDFLNCYEDVEPSIIPLEIIKQKDEILERIELTSLKRFKNYNDALARVIDYGKNYLRPQASPQMKYIIIYPKMGSQDIGIYSLSGRKYLKIAYLKNGRLIDLSLTIIIFMALYALGSICRYKPEIWNPFVRNDVSGEKLLIEKFLYCSRRLLPNLVLNHFLKKRICFVAETQGLLDFSGIITDRDVREIVNKEIIKTLDKQRRFI